MSTPGKRIDKPIKDKAAAEAEKADHKEQDDYLEEALEETFPASDPISPGHVHHDGERGNKAK